METNYSLVSVYNSHVASCLCFRLVTESFCPCLHSPNFLPCPHNLRPSFFASLNDNFQTKKLDALKWSFDWKFRDIQKHLFDLCMSQIVTVLAKENWISFSVLATKSFFVQSCPILMGQLWLCLFDRNACAMKQSFSHPEKRSCM